MGTYFIILFFLIFINLLFSKKKKLACIFSSIFLLFIIYIKSPFLGESDTLTIYYPRFMRIISMSFFETYNYFAQTDFIVAFYLITKIFTFFSNNYSLYLMFCSTPLIIAFSKMVYKHSNNVLLSYVIFFSLFYPWSWIILKHSISWGILILAFDSLLENKIKKYIILTLIASLFHPSALVFLILYFVLKMDVKKFHIIILILSFFLSFFFYKNISDIIFYFVKSGHYLMYEGKSAMFGVMGMLVYIFMFLFSTFFLSHQNKDIVLKKIYNTCWLGTIFVVFAYVIWDIYRIGMFFSIFYSLLIPLAISHIKHKQTREIINFILLIIFSLYGIKTFTNLNLLPIIFNF